MAVQLVVVVNPTAGRGRRAELADVAIERLRAAGHAVERLQAVDAPTLERLLRRRLDVNPPGAVVVAGGDGTVHLVANVLARSGIPLGILPIGSGNDAARSIGIPHDDPDACCARLIAALATDDLATKPVDAVRTSTGRWFVGVLSAGFDAAVNERANTLRWPRGQARYVLAVLLELARLTPHRYRITIDRDARQVDAVLVAVANTSTFGGGMRIAPGASTADGLLDVVVATPLPRFRLLQLLPRVFAGTHLTDDHVAVVHGRVVTVDVADRTGPTPVAYADGERLGPLPVTCEVVAAALAVLA
ncbi:diacylglycerol kinase family protein [Amnibacterium sp. CER49]|uniref:diacylglycerol/lipid kinase family protein n=1 Tax=Amnibacterium sp. CER49 TaxID=3039161 RepID=UPI002447457E|nr:diacylglycerol kinase family protein [Amnibacterium sp. CER49]MDH2444742.1 diacylglycerol kinase family protein [Amnibacterium sp. CER49]